MKKFKNNEKQKLKKVSINVSPFTPQDLSTFEFL